MTRIIGGSAGGRRIATPRGANTRPTSDRVREALFSAVESWCGSLSGLRFLDLYAGSGAVGLEAWSRGAGVVTLVEQDRRTASMISTNARDLGFSRAHVVASAGRLDAAPPTEGAVRRGVPRPAVRPSELVGRRRPRLHARPRLAGAGRDGDRRARLPGRRAALAGGLRGGAGRRSTARPCSGTFTPPRPHRTEAP